MTFHFLVAGSVYSIHLSLPALPRPFIRIRLVSVEVGRSLVQEALRFGSQHATNNFDGDVEATQRMAAQAEQVAMLLARAE